MKESGPKATSYCFLSPVQYDVTLLPRSRTYCRSSLMPWCSMARKTVLRMMQSVTITSNSVSFMMV